MSVSNLKDTLIFYITFEIYHFSLFWLGLVIIAVLVDLLEDYLEIIKIVL